MSGRFDPGRWVGRRHLYVTKRRLLFDVDIDGDEVFLSFFPNNRFDHPSQRFPPTQTPIDPTRGVVCKQVDRILGLPPPLQTTVYSTNSPSPHGLPGVSGVPFCLRNLPRRRTGPLLLVHSPAHSSTAPSPLNSDCHVRSLTVKVRRTTRGQSENSSV